MYKIIPILLAMMMLSGCYQTTCYRNEITCPDKITDNLERHVVCIYKDKVIAQESVENLKEPITIKLDNDITIDATVNTINCREGCYDKNITCLMKDLPVRELSEEAKEYNNKVEQCRISNGLF